MYSLRVNNKTKELVEEVAAMVNLPVSAIVRRVRKKIHLGKLRMSDDNTVSVTQMDGNVINFHVPATYHKNLDCWITAEDLAILNIREARFFRNCLVAACLDSKQKSAEFCQRTKALDEEYRKFNSQLIAERRALYAEVM